MERTGLPTDAFDLAIGNVPYSDAITEIDDDKSLIKLPRFHDSFVETRIHGCKFESSRYLEHDLETWIAKLDQRIRKIRTAIETMFLKKKQNQLRELSSQSATFDTRMAEAKRIHWQVRSTKRHPCRKPICLYQTGSCLSLLRFLP